MQPITYLGRYYLLLLGRSVIIWKLTDIELRDTRVLLHLSQPSIFGETG